MGPVRHRFAAIALGALVVLLVIACFEVRARGETFAGWWAYYAIYGLAAALVLARGIMVAPARGAWLAIGTGMLLYTAGSYYLAEATYFVDGEFGSGELPYPSVSDAMWLAFYPLAYLGIGLLLRYRVGTVPRSAWLDGAIGALAVAALATALVFPAVRDASSGTPVEVAVTLMYPLADALLLASLAGALAVSGWRIDRKWALITAGIAWFAAGDAAYLYLSATGSYDTTSAIDLTWPVAFLLIAFAAWGGRTEVARVKPSRRSLLLAPVGFGLLATGILMIGSVSGLEPVPAGLASATLVAVLLRLVLSFHENVDLLERTSEQSVTDDLTGLANRRRLHLDLERALTRTDGPGVALGLFDLNDFKAYNDAHGHLAGDPLLARLAARLSCAVAGHGDAYRLGGDEFCVLVSLRALDPSTLLTGCELALSEAGEGFSVTASSGIATLPGEASTAAEALGLADQRMYAAKRLNWRTRPIRKGDDSPPELPKPPAYTPAPDADLRIPV